VNRRNFLSIAGMGAVALALPAILAPRDPWLDFLERVHVKVVEIMRREHRGLASERFCSPLWMDKPVNGFRRVHIRLAPGGSLLQKLHFEFDEWSGE